MVIGLWKQRDLIAQLIIREVSQRYKGSLLGIVWSVLTPLLMLCVYTFVFGIIFAQRWSARADGQSPLGFALVFLCGISVYNIFAETISRASGVVAGNPNYIKRVVFPLEVLPVVLLGAALINSSFCFLILLLGNLLINGTVAWTVLLFPLVLLPLLFLALGFGWFLASLGVYIRDIAQVIPILVSALMFLSPIFYPVTAIPERFRPLFALNPLAFVIENSRRTLLWQELPEWTSLGIGIVSGAMVMYMGFFWFQKTRKGFADVI